MFTLLHQCKFSYYSLTFIKTQAFSWSLYSITTFQAVSGDPTYIGNTVHNRSSELQQSHSDSGDDVPVTHQRISVFSLKGHHAAVERVGTLSDANANTGT